MLESDGVYLYNVQILENDGVARGVVGNHAKLTIDVDDELVTVAYVDWEGKRLAEENRPITVKITGEVIQELVLTPVGGQISFDLPPAGCVITVATDFPCDRAEMQL